MDVALRLSHAQAGANGRTVPLREIQLKDPSWDHLLQPSRSFMNYPHRVNYWPTDLTHIFPGN